MRAGQVDLTPPAWRFRAYQGDPFDFAITVLVDGQPAEVGTWTWAAHIRIGSDMLAWECTGQPHGVALYLRGADTLRLPAHPCPFDVTGRDPLAGEGRTVLRGSILALARITPPLRRDAAPIWEAVPA